MHTFYEVCFKFGRILDKNTAPGERMQTRDTHFSPNRRRAWLRTLHQRKARNSVQRATAKYIPTIRTISFTIGWLFTGNAIRGGLLTCGKYTPK